MTNEELVSYIQQGTDRQHWLDLLCQQNRGLVARVANTYKSYMDIDDLMQEGYAALIEAADKYDPEAGANFATFAFLYLGHMLQVYVAKNQTAVRFPPRIRQLALKYRKLEAEYHKSLGADITPATAAALLDVTREDLDQAILASYRLHIRSLSEPLPGEEEITLEDALADPEDRIADLIDAAADENMHKLIWQVVDSLGPRLSSILRRRYIQGATLKEIAEDMGEEYYKITDAHARALRKIRRDKTYLTQIRPYYIDNYYAHTGLGGFMRSFTSQPEFLVMLHEKIDRAEGAQNRFSQGQ